jgi:hypothetical protein
MFQVRYLLNGRFVASRPARTMFEARRIANDGESIPAGTVSIVAIY